MPLLNYVIPCYSKGCPRPANFKIASRWSDGITSELKTYSLCCAECFPGRFRDSVRRHGVCRLAVEETLETPGIYRLQHGHRDRELERLREVELQLQRADQGTS
jgi:hypothetical protein